MDYTQMTEPKKKKGKKKREKDKPVAVSWHEFGKEEMVANELPTAPSEAPPPYQRAMAPRREAFQARCGSCEPPRRVSEADDANDWRSTMEPTVRPVAKRPVTAPSSERALDEDWRRGGNMTSAPARVIRDTESNWRQGSEPIVKPPEKPRVPQAGPRNTESNWRMGSRPTKKPTKNPTKNPTKKPVKPVEPKIQRDYNRSWRRLS